MAKQCLPVFRSPHWEKSSNERVDTVERWLTANKTLRRSKLQEAYRETGGRDWVRQLCEDWRLIEYSSLELQGRLGLSKGQISRLLNAASAGIGVLGLWAAQQGQVLPPPNYLRFGAKGLC